jgi:hypothetical protein
VAVGGKAEEPVTRPVPNPAPVDRLAAAQVLSTPEAKGNDKVDDVAVITMVEVVLIIISK